MIFFANVLILVLFLAKLLWTAATPIAVKIETQKLPIEDRDRAKKRRVSMAAIVEIILLLALVLISAVTGRGIFHLSAFRLFIAGVGAIVLSYGCCALVGRIVRRV